MDISKDFNVDDYRRRHESIREWKLRRAFILSNKDQLDMEDLITLASCYVNVHFYGCSYPEDLMQRLSHYENNVEKSLITDYKPEKQEASNTSTKVATKRKMDEGTWKPPPHRDDKVNMTNANQTPTLPSEFAHLERKFKILSSLALGLLQTKQLDDVSILQMSVDKNKMTSNLKYQDLPEKKFSCTLQIDCINVSEGVAKNKKQAKIEAYKSAMTLLKMPYLKIDKSKINFNEFKLVGSTHAYNNHKELKRPKLELNTSLREDLVLMCHHDAQHNSTTFIRRSAEFNRTQIEFDVEYLMKENAYECRLSMEGKIIATDKRDSREDAMSGAAELALELLKKKHYTIICKGTSDIDISGAIQKEQMLLGENSSTPSLEEPIPDSNIGNKLLRMMGWSGGGVGKEGNQGISNPIGLSTVNNREGLGMQRENGICPEFQPSVTRIVEDFIKSDKQEDLVFAPSFSTKERAIIHGVAQKLHLRTKSYNKGEERYLVLSRKRSPQELMTHLQAHDGETLRYKLVPPTG